MAARRRRTGGRVRALRHPRRPRSRLRSGLPWRPRGLAGHGTDLLADVELPADADESGFLLHPALLDAALHPIGLGGLVGDGGPLRLARPACARRRRPRGTGTAHPAGRRGPSPSTSPTEPARPWRPSPAAPAGRHGRAGRRRPHPPPTRFCTWTGCR
ncbi:hypothetical protein LT493_43755 [Streptomyces tricolor]|nr:hypothetical protein [Streptomyces tricolor]